MTILCIVLSPLSLSLSLSLSRWCVYLTVFQEVYLKWCEVMWLYSYCQLGVATSTQLIYTKNYRKIHPHKNILEIYGYGFMKFQSLIQETTPPTRTIAETVATILFHRLVILVHLVGHRSPIQPTNTWPIQNTVKGNYFRFVTGVSENN